MSDYEISPSILAADFLKLGDEVNAIQEAGAQSLHIDIMDGHFVPKISFGPDIIKVLRKTTSLRLDAHLMAYNSERLIDESIGAGADRVFIHQEISPHNYRLITQIRSQGASPAIVICPGTPAIMLEELLPIVDCVLVMTVNPGLGGQKFLTDQLQKIQDIKAMIERKNLSTEIAVDGGINMKTAPLVSKAGATTLIAGSAVFKAKNYRASMEGLLSACKNT